MRILISKPFAKFIRKEGISHGKLCEAIDRSNKGNIDANYGGGVIKQRISRNNEGLSVGYRSIILFRSRQNSFFVYG
jgi:hypothetical protein